MRQRFLLLALLGLNVILAAGWIVAGRQVARSRRSLPPAPATTQLKTNVLVRRQFFSWQQLESRDYPTYIRNLREIGCPEQTIRDIIVADVNQLYAPRLARVASTADERWWSNDNRAANEAVRKLRLGLEAERRGLLAELLGTNWEGRTAVVKRPVNQLPLEGPVLGAMSAETKQAVRDLVNQAEAQARAEGLKPGNAAEVVRLEKELWNKLAGVLTAEQLEEFRLRYSANAGELRRELDSLRRFQTSPEEFRALFRATDEIDNQLRALGNATDPSTVAKRQDLEAQRDAAMKGSLGAKRFTEFTQLQDPAYQDALSKAEAAGGSAQSVQTLYKINQEMSLEQASIQQNPNLTDAQKEIELKKAELEQLKAQAQALGQELPPEPAPPAPPPPPKSATVIPHLVTGTSQNLNTISRLYNVSPQQIMDSNPGIDFSKNLTAGATINIPYGAPPPLPPSP